MEKRKIPDRGEKQAFMIIMMMRTNLYDNDDDDNYYVQYCFVVSIDDILFLNCPIELLLNCPFAQKAINSLIFQQLFELNFVKLKWQRINFKFEME